MHHGIFSESRAAVVVLIIQPHKWKTVGREFRARRVNLYFIDGFVDGVRFRGCVEVRDSLAAEAIHAHIRIRAVWNVVDTQNLPADHHVVAYSEPGAPREARGRHEVRFWVTADGRVVRVAVTPPIKDSEYRREFTERMMGYLFNPATTRDGRHVESIASLIVYP